MQVQGSGTLLIKRPFDLQEAVVLLDVYLKTLVSGKQEEDITTYYKQNGTAYALYGIVNAWILRGYKESPEQMVEILYNLHKKLEEKTDLQI